MAKRTTPPEDYNRFAEWLRNRYGKKIKDKKTFEDLFKFTLDKEDLSDKEKSFQKEVWNVMKEKHNLPDVSDVPTPKISKAGIKEKKIRDTQFKRKLELIGKIGHKTVFVSEELVNNRGYERIVYRDRTGRFASRRK